VKEFTMVWSVNNGSEQKEQERRCLTPAMRARKALVRLLGACEEGCRDRRVKVFLPIPRSHNGSQLIIN
jgi:hypothetical protein